MDTNTLLKSNESRFLQIFILSTCLKIGLIPAYHSTDFEVHRNWLAITYSLPMKLWYYDTTSEWTLDYPPFFAYFEWLLSQLAQFIDPEMLKLHNHNYASNVTKIFQRMSVILMDVIYAWGVWRLLNIFKKLNIHYQPITAEVLLLMNVGLIFIDHIHFQYNGFLFGILLLSISYMLEERYLMGCFLFASLLNFKHIFLYIAPAFAAYLLRFYCLTGNGRHFCITILQLICIGLLPFILSFGPFYRQLPQLLSRLFPFKRGLTHAYWAPNLWALYNTGDKVVSIFLKMPTKTAYTSGLVQEYQHVALPTITPLITFVLTGVAMIPILIKLIFFTDKRHSKIDFLRTIVLCSLTSFIFGWHVHEKAIIITLVPLCFLYFVDTQDAKYAYLLSTVGYASLFPLLFDPELLIIRYSLYMAYMIFMLSQYIRFYKKQLDLNVVETCYIYGLVLLPFYEHAFSLWYKLNIKLPFMTLLITSFYCSIGVLYVYIRYYTFVLDIKFNIKQTNQKKLKLKKTM